MHHMWARPWIGTPAGGAAPRERCARKCSAPLGGHPCGGFARRSNDRRHHCLAVPQPAGVVTVGASDRGASARRSSTHRRCPYAWAQYPRAGGSLSCSLAYRRRCRQRPRVGHSWATNPTDRKPTASRPPTDYYRCSPSAACLQSLGNIMGDITCAVEEQEKQNPQFPKKMFFIVRRLVRKNLRNKLRIE
ncbi:hypothetical protein C4D60_Mb08t16560 [Musa balbisiana]|uniref:Uncharacterized protein n=1 Tax=Musa balbisiana TaxID=52838 RepID=A0A4S8K4B6_MUSBA|nr:hypothetical protein C4D60_Mb08t16560 [Musa balbisiana]